MEISNGIVDIHLKTMRVSPSNKYIIGSSYDRLVKF